MSCVSQLSNNECFDKSHALAVKSRDAIINSDQYVSNTINRDGRTDVKSSYVTLRYITYLLNLFIT